MTTLALSAPAPATGAPTMRPPTQARSSTGAIAKNEMIVAGVAAILLLVLRWFYIHSNLWNSDEPQHLHVVWGWANGLLPYRDVFDNHSPLFQMLSVPVFKLFGTRPDIVTCMRFAMVPLFALSLWLTYRIGANVFSPRAGLWSAILLAFFPKFFFMMGQYRTDVFWVVCWLGTLAVATGGPLTAKRLFFAGLLFGATFSVSMKTSLLLLMLVIAGVVTGIASLFLRPRGSTEGPGKLERFSSLAAGLGGMLLIPAALIAFFASKGLLHQLYYCVIEHNILPGDQSSARVLERLTTKGWLTLLPAAACAATVFHRFTQDRSRAAWQLLLIVSAGLFYPLLHGFWRMVTLQDYLPWFPLLALVAAYIVTFSAEAAGRRWGASFALPLLLLFTGMELRWMLRSSPIFSPGSAERIEAIAEALDLTKPGEYVMDPKGDLIFHRRPYFYALETLTIKRLHSGLIIDDLIQRLIDTQTAVVAIEPSRMTPEDVTFVHQNYLSIGYLAVLGKMLPPIVHGVVAFDVAIPAQYTFVARQGTVTGPITGTIDGQPIGDSCWLTPGRHELRTTSSAYEVALFWARAADKGFSPFHQRTLLHPKSAS